MLHRYLIGYDATWINNLRLHFRLPPFAKNAKDGAPIFLLMTGRSKAWATRQSDTLAYYIDHGQHNNIQSPSQPPQ